MKTFPTLLCAILATTSLSALAAGSASSDTLPGCVSLSESHRGARGPGDAQLLLKDGDQHYRVRFDGRCAALTSAKVYVRTGDQTNRLCPTGSSVQGGNRLCAVESVETIDAADYKRARR